MSAEAALVVAVAAAVAASAVSAYASYEQGEQQKKVAKYNQRAAENQAALEKEKGRLAAESERDRQRRLLATQHVRQAASGVLTTEGSPLVVAMDSARQAERDQQLIRFGTDVRATGWAAEAELQRSAGRWYQRAGTMNAGVSLLQGASSVASIYGTRTRASA
jgi:hypothetical protein